MDANGLLLYEARVVLHRVGVWTADIACQPGTDTALAGRVTLNVGDLVLRGVCLAGRNGTAKGARYATLKGGAGGLSKKLPARAYRNVPLSVIVRDLLTESGETLATDADAALLSRMVPQWSRMAQRASESLTAVADMLGCVWRVKPDGTVWLGNDTWPVMNVADATLMDEQPDQARRTYGVLNPSLLPGTTFDGQRVSTVEHIATSRAIRTIVYVESAS